MLPSATASMRLLAAAVIVHDPATDRVVLLRRGPRAKFARGRWDLPVGKNDPGEPVTATAVRELREETGLVVAEDELRLAHVVHGARSAESSAGYLTVVFAARAWSGELVNAEPEKHSEVCWTPLDAVPDDALPQAAEALARYRAGEHAVLLTGWEPAATAR
ncbi:NUDIX domain-containing protein [Streptomyces sp. TRM 70351]|uniref:NUDIX domain-containing protein n=1 Tax=Streptomyces sp. TRM 70351 TaxID=3116552 RepID=UPI002E7BD9D0|nr:NUDIX domain-containing protein [Streptomyces sp. TRM 70351]MEE1927639.1 NUDIX domain-containing protein [Streptomyces sp. TRM 70351]